MINQSQIDFKLNEACASKLNEIKTKINQLQARIKSKAVEQMNTILEREIDLLYQLDNIECELTSKLKQFQTASNKSSTDCLNQINQLDFNYDFKLTDSNLKIGSLIIKVNRI